MTGMKWIVRKMFPMRVHSYFDNIRTLVLWKKKKTFSFKETFRKKVHFLQKNRIYFSRLNLSVLSRRTSRWKRFFYLREKDETDFAIVAAACLSACTSVCCLTYAEGHIRVRTSFKWRQWKMDIWLDFTKMFIQSFYKRRSQKHKNSVKLSVSFCALGISVRKSFA